MNASNNQSSKTNGQPLNDLSFSEAPASWNTRYIDPNGFECQITLRGDTGSELLERVASAIAYLLNHGCIPYVYRATVRQADNKADEGKKDTPKSNGMNGTNGSNGTNNNPSWCPIHQCEMKRWEKADRVWYSHKVDGSWCRGKSS